MSEHTKGPWRVGRLEGRLCVTLGPPTGSIIARVDQIPPHAWANAQLIAAAPDLLEAAIAIQAADVTTAEIEAARDKLDAAIAKATGGTNA